MKLPKALQRVWQFNQTERDRWIAARAAEVPAGARVLDVGAGACVYAPLFAHCEYRSQDFAQLDTAQLPSGYGRIDYVSDITAIPAPDESFDVVLSTEVLEHVPDPAAAVREMSRLLKPGGRVILTAPLGSSIHQQPFHYYGGYTPYWYDKVLGEAGFTNIAVEPNGGFFKQYGQESIRFAQFTAPWRVKSPLALLLSPVWAIGALWFVGLCPLVCHLLDRLDRAKHHTVGYHVTAVKRHREER